MRIFTAQSNAPSHIELHKCHRREYQILQRSNLKAGNLSFYNVLHKEPKMPQDTNRRKTKMDNSPSSSISSISSSEWNHFSISNIFCLVSSSGLICRSSPTTFSCMNDSVQWILWDCPKHRKI